MKKILFSLAALAALSMVAVGCKKASDGAKTKDAVQEMIDAVKSSFKTLQEVCKGAEDSSTKTQCKDNESAKKVEKCFTEGFKKAVDALDAAGYKVDELKSEGLTAKTKEDALWDSSGAKANGLKTVEDSLTNLEPKVKGLTKETLKRK